MTPRPRKRIPSRFGCAGPHRVYGFAQCVVWIVRSGRRFRGSDPAGPGQEGPPGGLPPGEEGKRRGLFRGRLD